MFPVLAPELSGAVGLLVDLAVARLAGRTGAGQGLEGVKLVVRGDEVGGPIGNKIPVIWVHGVIGSIADEGGSFRDEGVNVILVITAITQSPKPEIGGRLSQKLALRSLWELRHDDAGGFDPKLGVTWVDDVRLERFELSTGEQQKGLYGSALQAVAKIRTGRV